MKGPKFPYLSCMYSWKVREIYFLFSAVESCRTGHIKAQEGRMYKAMHNLAFVTKMNFERSDES